ncbi:MAG TPA: hypothetical protein PK076_03430 [Saprospiraceae bacterium]|nr:hypothetical protein [Saprospiraceae bacterium]HQW55146.1 hypothetical protein [Saprospiraceae bacterium]
MTTLKLVSLITMSSIYCFTGVSHFLKPGLFLRITPKWVPYPEIINIAVGVIEVVLGISLLFNVTRSYAAVGIIVLLIAVFPANVYHFQLAKRKGKNVIPTLIRIPVQVLLIYWAYTFI